MAFKDLFIKPDEPEVVKKDNTNVALQQPVQSIPQPAVNVQSVVQQPIQSVSASDSGTASTNESSEDTIRAIWSILLQKNLPGPDYLEVRSSASALESMGLSVDKRYEAAFKLLQSGTPGFTKESLLSSIDTYEKYVNEELSIGLKQCEEKRDKEIGGTNNQISSLQARSAEISNKIAELQAEKAKVDAECNDLQQQVTVITQNIDKEEKIFRNSIDVVFKTLQSDREIMTNLNI